MMDTKKSQLYIGRESETDEPVLLKASSLTTHGVVFGMTGSGKTGLGVNILEEAALSEIPTLILDPKGDMGNIMLTFPQLRPEDFRPWVNARTATDNGDCFICRRYPLEQAHLFFNNLIRSIPLQQANRHRFAFIRISNAGLFAQHFGRANPGTHAAHNVFF